MGSWEQSTVPSIAWKLFIIVLLLTFLEDHAVVGDNASDKKALLAFKAAVGKRLNWSQSTNPCTPWFGITCIGSSVTEVRLPGRSLFGSIPSGILGNLSELGVLSLRYNSLNGPIPSDLGKCTKLRKLYLQSNGFTGPIPSFFSTFPNLVILNLAFNRFSGPIPSSLSNLQKLATLYLDNNSLNGSISALNPPNLQQLNVSNNQLNGSVPPALRKFPASSFLGNSLCGSPLLSCEGVAPSPSPSSGHKGKNKLGAWAIVGIVLGCLAFLVLLFLILFLCKRKKKRENPRVVEFAPGIKAPDDAPEDTIPKEDFPAPPVQEVEKNTSKRLVFFEGSQRTFDLEDLLRASAEVLGKGSVGTAYKAVLEFGLVVAVKRLKDVVIGQKEFVQQIEQVGKMQHENLVPLRAYYFSKDEKLLVYDYMTMGSLSSLLHGNRGAGRTPLDWETRSRIALGAARGIEYLHSRGREISHGNIKSSNILLTRDYNAGVSDFGLAQLVSSTPSANRIVGYRAPEVTDARKISQKADVFSFGVLLLEILTGKAPSHGANDDGVDLPRWVQSIVREEWTAEVFDIELLRHHNFEEDMVQLLQVAIDCVAQYPDQRPSMKEVVKRIEDLRQNIEDDDGPEDLSSSAEIPD